MAQVSAAAGGTGAALRRLAARLPIDSTIAGNASFLIGDKLLRLVVALVTNALIARELGPASYGLFNWAVALVALMGAIGTVGLPDILVREFVQKRDRADELEAAAIWMRLCGGALVLLIAVAASALLRPGEAHAAALVAVVALSQIVMAFDAIDQRLQADYIVRPVVLIRAGSYLGFALLRIVAALQGADVLVFGLLFSAEFGCVALLLNWRARRTGAAPHLRRATRAAAAVLWRDGAPMLARLLAIGVYMRADQLLLARLLDDRAVGIYAAAARLSEIWYLVPVSLAAAFAPKLNRSFAQSRAEYDRELAQLMRLAVAGSALFAAAVTIAAPLVVRLLYGPAYAASAAVLSVHCWAGVFVTAGTLATNWFVNTGLLKYGFYQTVLGVVVSVGLNLLLIPRLGVMGAAVAVLLSQAVSAVLANALWPQTRPVFRIQLRAMALLGPR